jgi:hypothetical protein
MLVRVAVTDFLSGIGAVLADIGGGSAGQAQGKTNGEMDG